MPIYIKSPNPSLNELYERLYQDELIINSLKEGMVFKGEFETYQDMIDYFDGSTAEKTPLTGFLVYVSKDENYNNERTMYIYDESISGFRYGGSVTNVPSASKEVKGVIRLNGDLSGSSDYPTLSKTGVVSGTYNFANNIVTISDTGRILNINVSTTEEWTYVSEANSRTEKTNTFTVPEYNVTDSLILFFYNGNLLLENRDYVKTNETTITTLFDVNIDDDIIIKNLKMTGKLDSSVIINDNVENDQTCYSSAKTK